MVTFSTGSRRGLAMSILIFASFMDLLDVTIVQVALPTIRTDLDTGEATLEWIVSGYMLAFAVLFVTGGRCGDIIGRQRTFLLGVGGFTLVSAVAAAAPTDGRARCGTHSAGWIRGFDGAAGAFEYPGAVPTERTGADVRHHGRS